jgi:hypothetical protein
VSGSVKSGEGYMPLEVCGRACRELHLLLAELMESIMAKCEIYQLIKL